MTAISMGIFVVLAFLVTACVVEGEDVVFGSRVFQFASASDCNDADYTDQKATGSYLISKRGENSALRTLSMDIQLTHYTSSAGMCFRAHPVFIECIQNALSELKSAKKRALVIQGFRLRSELGSSAAPEDIFAVSGTAVTLMPESRNSADLLGIAKSVLRHCPIKLERIQRNLGIVMKANSVYAYMGGPTDPPALSLNGFTLITQSDFATQGLAAINEGLELGRRTSNCTLFERLGNGEVYPPGSTSPETSVGPMDMPVTRTTIEDFKQLVLYLGTNVQFDNNERSAAWCGQSGRPCYDCRNGPVDATLDKRCTARLMSARMHNVLILLQKLVQEVMGDGLQVQQAFDEDYEGHAATGSLHREGRALTLRLTSGNAAALDTLSNLAICAKADFVQHNGDHLLLAVQKQYGSEESGTQFSQVTLVRVEPPSSQQHLVQLPTYFTQADQAAFPVFDSYGREALELSPYAKLGYFVSPRSRYFRLNRYIPDCFSRLQEYFLKNNNTDGEITLEVVRGFLTTPEQDETMITTDLRYASGVLGLSFEVRANTVSSTTNISMAALARLVVIQCTPVFRQAGEYVGVGVYNDRVYIDMRDNFQFWNPAGSFSTQVSSAAEFSDYIQRLYQAAYESRMVDPDMPEEAAALAEPPSPQSPTYRHSHTERIHRRRRSVPDVTECVPRRNTPFCTTSTEARKVAVANVWKEAIKKHNYHDLAETKQAFEKCFNDCGTCMSGVVYHDKIEHCSNYLHWSPFEIAPPGTSINLFPRDSESIRQYACHSSSAHCIEDSALFLLLVNLFEATYRPNPSTSVVQELYPQTENPSPVADLLHQLYATHAQGVAKVWVRDESDLTAMRVTLEKLMLYNKNVTKVEVYVKEKTNKAAVESVLRTLMLEWTTTGSPLYTREFVAPFTLKDFPQGISKRSAEEHKAREDLISRVHSWEDRWIRWEL